MLTDDIGDENANAGYKAVLFAISRFDNLTVVKFLYSVFAFL